MLCKLFLNFKLYIPPGLKRVRFLPKTKRIRKVIKVFVFISCLFADKSQLTSRMNNIKVSKMFLFHFFVQNKDGNKKHTNTAKSCP